MKIAFYIPYFNNIGGIESWIYYISKLYGEGRDITVYYISGDEAQLDRLKPTFRVRRFYHQKIECDLAVFAFTVPNDVLECFKAKRKVQFIHACYSYAYGIKELKPNPLIDEYIAVSQTAADDFYNLTGVMPRVMYNPVYLEKPKKVLILISATRISEDKGSIWNKMKILANKFNEAGLPILWLVFTNSKKVSDVKNVVFLPPELNIGNYIAMADYLVQLSKTEADCLSIKESLSLGVPVLVTNFAAALENGVVDGKTGYIFNMEMDNVDVHKIYNNIPKFEYKLNSSPKDWEDLLGPKHKVEKDKMVKVRCCFREGFPDLEDNVYRKYGSVWECTMDRALYLEDFKDPNTLTNYHLVDIIE